LAYTAGLTYEQFLADQLRYDATLRCLEVIGEAANHVPARVNADSVLELNPDLVGPTTTRVSGIIGECADLSLEHLADMRRSMLLMHLTKRLLYAHWRDAGEEPKLHLFGQLKSITREWLDGYLVCSGGTYPARLVYQELADSHPCVVAYVKNHGLGLEVPDRYGSVARTYLPDFIVGVDDGRGENDLLNVVVEIKGYRGEDAKEKKSTTETYWVPGVNYLGAYGRWAFAELRDVFSIEKEVRDVVEAAMRATASRAEAVMLAG
jgi:hypothetical protein